MAGGVWARLRCIGTSARTCRRHHGGAASAGRRGAERLGGRVTLALGTMLAAFGYVVAGYSTGLVGLCVALVAIGCGLSTQHPIGSAAVARAYQEGSRGPLGTYNFAGDVGKAVIPSGASLLLILMSWHQMLWVFSALGAIVAVAVAIFLPADLGAVSVGRRPNSAHPAPAEGLPCSWQSGSWIPACEWAS